MTQQDWNNANDQYNDCIAAGQDPSFCQDFVQSAYPDFDSSGNGSNGSPLTDYWNNPNNWIDFTGGLTGIIGNIVGMANGQQPNQYGQYPQQQQQPQDNTMWWIIGAVAIVFFILLLVLIFRK